MRNTQEAWTEKEETVSLAWLAQSLKIQARWVLAGFLLGILLGVLFVLLTPKQYEAQAKLEVESPGNIGSLGGLSALIGGGSPNANAQIEVLLSRPVLERVHQAFSNDEPYEQFAKRFRASVVRNTSLIEVSAKADTPERAAELTNFWVETYLTQVQDLYTRNPSLLVQKLSEELDQQEQAVRQASQKIVAFLKQKQLVAPDKELEKAIEKYATLQSQLLEQQGRIQALTRQIADLKANLQQVPQYYEALRTLAIPPEVQELNRRLAELEIERRAKLEVYQPTAPEVQLVEAQIAQAREEREKLLANAIEAQFLTLSRQQTVNPIYQGMLETLWKAEVERNALQTTTKLLEQKIAEMDARFQGTPELIAEYGDLKRQYESALVLWTEKVKAYEQARAQQLVGRVMPIVIESATPPERPVAPRPVLYTAVTTMLGTLIGLIVAIGRAFRDRRVRSRWDVERLLGVPVLAELPANASPQQAQFVVWALRAWGGGEAWHTALALPMGDTPSATNTAHALAQLCEQAETPEENLQETLPAPVMNGVLRVKVANTDESLPTEAERLLLIIPRGYEFDERLLLTLQQAQPQIVGAILVEVNPSS